MSAVTDDVRSAGLLVNPAPPAPSARVVATSHLRAWWGRHATSLLIATPLLVLGAFVHAIGSARTPAFSDDEGTYTAQAYAVRELHRLAHYTYWYDHPPFGWIQLAGWQWLTGPFTGQPALVNARTFLVVLSVVSGLLLYVLARRLGIARGWAAVALVLWAFSPLVVATSRQVYLDGIALPWLLAAFVLAASPRRSLWAYAGSGACFAGAALSKETSLLLLPALILLARQRSDRSTRAFCLTAFGSALLLLLASYPVLAVLKGELLPGSGHVSLLEALRFQLWGRASTGSALVPGTISNGLLSGWLHQDTWLLALGCVATLPALLSRRLRAVGVAMVALLAAGLRPGYLPESFVVTVLPFAALAVAGALDLLWRSWPEVPARRRTARALAVVAGVVIASAAAPGWAQADRNLMRRDDGVSARAAEQWLRAHADRSSRILVDDTYWTDLVEAGFPRQNVVWLYKTDFVNNLDPSVARVVRAPVDLGYLVVSPVVRATLARAPASSYALVRQALASSTVLASFGSGTELVEIRKVATASAPATP